MKIRVGSCFPSRAGALVALIASSGVVACGGSNGSPSARTDGAPGALLPGSEAGTSDARIDRVVPRPDGGPSASDAGVGAYDALTPLPQVVNSDGGVLASPVLVAVFFSNEDQTLLPTLEQFYMGIGATTYWKALSEYGIGPATAQIKVLTEAAPATIDDTQNQNGDNTALETWLLGKISDGTLPAVGPNITYILHYPATTKVTASGNQCVDFDGYHYDLQTAAGATLSYAVVPRCTDMGSTLIDTFSSTASHEAIEAVTDPYPDYAPAYAQADNAHLFWDEANTGSEIGDMCQDDPEANYKFSDFPFLVQRFWSNTSVNGRHDPCVPEIPGAIFFNAIPELPDTSPFPYYGTMVDVDSVHIPVGQSKTIYLDVYSDGPLPAWDIQALDYNYYFGTGSDTSALLKLEMATTTGKSGDRIPVNITVTSVGNPSTNGQNAKTELFFIQSSQGTSQTAPAHYWYGLVTN